MAYFNLTETAPKFASVYKPILWGWNSLRSPVNLIPGESVAITSINVATAADVVTYPLLTVGDVFVVHAFVSPATWNLGQAVKISGTANGTYDGTWKVLLRAALDVTVINAPPGSIDIGGTIAKFYERYCLIAEVDMPGLDKKVYRRIRSDVDGVFRLDIRRIAQRCFDDVFALGTPGLPTDVIPTTEAITQAYTAKVWEAYMVPNSDGVNVFFEFVKGDISKLNGVAVNSVQPYAHLGGLDNTDHVWQEDLGDYVMNISTTGSNVKRFLTYSPRGISQTTGDPDPNEYQVVGMDDDLYLAFLFGGNSGLNLFVTVESYDANDTIIGSPVNITVESPSLSGIIPIGPRNLGANIDPAAHHYKVGLRNEDEFFISEQFAFQIDRTCYRDPRRFFFLNQFGAIDAYTATGREALEDRAERDTLQKDHMARDLFPTAGDWQRRTWKVEPERRYNITTNTIPKNVLRWLSDQMCKSPDVRIATDPTGSNVFVGTGIWTRVILTTEVFELGSRSGRLAIEYAHGTDNVRQFR